MKFILAYLLVASFAIAVLTELPASPPKAVPSPPATGEAVKLNR